MSTEELPVKDRIRVPVTKLRWHCPEECLKFESTSGVAPVKGTIGQDRALQALKLGLEVYSPGYNVYVSGLVGTGRSTTVKEVLGRLAPQCALPRDRAYVRNFSHTDKPRLLTFPAGGANAFLKEIKGFVKYLKSRLPTIFEDKDVSERREQIVKGFQEREQETFKAFQEKVQQEGFSLVSVQAGPVQQPDIFPNHEGEALPPPKYAELIGEGKITQEQYDQAMERIDELQDELKELMRRGRAMARDMSQEVEALHREVGLAVIAGPLEDLRETWAENEAVVTWLKEVEQDVLENLPIFSAAEGEGAAAAERQYDHYKVNVICDHSETKGCPVVVAANPTHSSLFGTIERVMEAPGLWRSDHMMIKGGSLLDADGGYLILYAIDVLQQPGVWQMLMRTLKSESLEIGLPELPFLGMTTGLKPEPIDLSVKVVLIGEPNYYHLLYRHDPQFRKIFKIKADFSADMLLSEGNLEDYAKVVARICEKESLLPLSREAIGRLAEWSVRQAGRQDKISTRFADVADTVREANYWCTAEEGDMIKRAHVQKAIEARAYRSGLLDSRIQELMEKDVLIIQTEGAAVGQVNGLSVYDLGFHAFGKPTLITASTAVGQAGIINVEREARLSGGIYDKGVLIISGYLRQLFARKRPLALTASLCFEQSYSGVDGDSASIAEVFALLSDLSGIPIDQGIAVTGSINQRGEIQPIGGANEKIEGFYNLCKSRGLTGTQGVMIPARNVGDLMLNSEVVEACRQGRFHVWGVSSIEDGIEVLTGVPAGRAAREGEYPKGTVFHAVEEKLEEYNDVLRGKDEPDWKPLPVLDAGGRPAATPEPDLPPRTPPVAESDD